MHVLSPQQDLAATAIAGGELPDEQSPEDMAGDYSWDCEYNFDLLVSFVFRIRSNIRIKQAAWSRACIASSV
jgi:hypothetical protein